MKTIFKGYGVCRKGRLLEYFRTKNKNKVENLLKVYNDCFKDKNTAIYPIEILRGEKIK